MTAPLRARNFLDLRVRVERIRPGIACRYSAKLRPLTFKYQFPNLKYG